MKKKLLATAFTCLMTLSSLTTAFAGQWQQNPATSQWNYLQDTGIYVTNDWQWIDGNLDGIAECYYFDANGNCLMNTVTPDGCNVDGNGAWIVNGIVQTQTAAVSQPVILQEAAPQIQEAVPQITSGIATAPYDGYTIVVNTNTHKYHVPSCNSVGDIKPENLGYSSDSAYLNSNGYAACKKCH